MMSLTSGSTPEARARRAARVIAFLSLAIFFSAATAPAVIRDGGIDPANLGKGSWIYAIKDATNKLSGHVSSVTNENSLMLFYKSAGIRYLLVKAGTGTALYYGCQSFPQLTTSFINTAHNHGIWVFGYNRSYGTNTAGEVAIANFVFNQGADGFVWDAEAEWESAYLGNQGPALAWAQCSQVRSNWPNKFLAHAPFPIISYHSSFPYNEFGYWCDAVMPQIYHSGWSGVKGTASGGINWCDVNFARWQNSLIGSNSVINEQTIWWTNAIKPIAPVENCYGESNPYLCNGPASAQNPKDVMEFMDYLTADPHSPSPGGYNGASFWRADLHGAVQWQNIAAGTMGPWPGKVNHLVLDDPRSVTVGSWTAVRTFSNGAFTGSGSGTDTNSFGTNYLIASHGVGSRYAVFTPNVIVPGTYEIYQWHVSRPDASAAVPHHIQHAGGTTTVYANQQTNGGNWSLLGRFYLNEGSQNAVRVTDATTDNGVAIVDGIKLIFVPPASLPGAPSELDAQPASASQIDLAWRNNATNATGFVVARGAHPGGPFNDIGSTRASLTNYSDTGLPSGTTFYYQVRATNWLGASSASAPASARTPGSPAAPGIDAPPQPQTVRAGQDALFTVAATGNPEPGYQWWFESAPLPGATASSYVRSNVQPAHAGLYSVVVSNSLGSLTSAPALLTVRCLLNVTASAGGSVTRFPNQPDYAPNTPVTLTAWAEDGQAFAGWSGDAAGSSNPLVVQLTTNLQISARFVSTSTDLILDNPDPEVVFSGEWQTGSTAPGHYGEDYRFALTRAGGSSNVVYRPYLWVPGLYDVFIYYPAGGNRTTNAPWSIRSLDGTHALAVNQQINGGTWLQIGSALPFAQGENGWVGLSNDTGDEGKVVLADAVRFTLATPFTEPAITTQPQSRTNNLGTDASFSAAASGSPPPAYQWNFNGAPLPGATGSNYTRAQVQKTDAGAYSVTVSNLLGSVVSDDAMLELVPAPRIESITNAGGLIQLQISGGPGNLAVDASADFLNWSNLSTFRTTNELAPFADADTNQPARFYRARGLP